MKELIEGVGPANLMEAPGCRACMDKDSKSLLIMLLEYTILEIKDKDRHLRFEFGQSGNGFAAEPEPGTPASIAVNAYTTILKALKKTTTCGTGLDYQQQLAAYKARRLENRHLEE
jgi:hypothetical protein